MGSSSMSGADPSSPWSKSANDSYSLSLRTPGERVGVRGVFGCRGPFRKQDPLTLSLSPGVPRERGPDRFAPVDSDGVPSDTREYRGSTGCDARATVKREWIRPSTKNPRRQAPWAYEPV